VEFVDGVMLAAGVVLLRLEVLRMLVGVSTIFVGRGVDVTVSVIVETAVVVEPAAMMVTCEAPMQEQAEE
jgi:hypothetical protein